MKKQILPLLLLLIAVFTAPQQGFAQLVPKGDLAPAPRPVQVLPPPRGQGTVKAKKLVQPQHLPLPNAAPAAGQPPAAQPPREKPKTEKPATATPTNGV